MHIDSYSFGKIIIDGKEYSRDLLIFPEGEIRENWQRVEGHELAPEDIEEVLNIKPDIFIMGTGYSAILKILPETELAFKNNHIELIAKKTSEAFKIFNELLAKKEKRVMAGLHLTC